MKQDNITPVYMHTAAYAREHGELDLFRNSNIQNALCCEAIEKAISTHFDGFRLDPNVVNPVFDSFGTERVQYVLANTVQLKKWDGRFSPANKEWADTIPIVEDNANGIDRRLHFVINSHPAVLDGFVQLARKAIQELERPSVLQKLKEASHRRGDASKKPHTKTEVR